MNGSALKIRPLCPGPKTPAIAGPRWPQRRAAPNGRALMALRPVAKARPRAAVRGGAGHRRAGTGASHMRRARDADTRTQPDRSRVRSRRAAPRIASISACAVGLTLVTTRLGAALTTTSPRSTTAPSGWSPARIPLTRRVACCSGVSARDAPAGHGNAGSSARRQRGRAAAVILRTCHCSTRRCRQFTPPACARNPTFSFDGSPGPAQKRRIVDQSHNSGAGVASAPRRCSGWWRAPPLRCAYRLAAGRVVPFSTSRRLGELPDGWHEQVVRRDLPRTSYAVVQRDDRRVLQAVSDGGASLRLRCECHVDPWRSPGSTGRGGFDRVDVNATVAADELDALAGAHDGGVRRRLRACRFAIRCSATWWRG